MTVAELEWIVNIFMLVCIAWLLALTWICSKDKGE